MLLQLKKLWRRWAIRRCRYNNYTILPRRKFLYLEDSSNPVCRFLGGFYCVSGSLPVFLLIIAAITILILFLNGVTISGTLFFVGWRPTAVISISLLNTIDEVNFPNDDIDIPRTNNIINTSSKYHASSNDTSVLTSANNDSGVLWKVDGFSKYIEEFSDDPDILGMFGKLPSGKKLDRKGNGFWVYNFDPSKVNNVSFSDTSNVGAASIRALSITEHMNVNPEEVEVAVAIRAYVDGEAAIVIKYEDSLSRHVHTQHIKREEFKDKGFCYKILDVPFHKKINMIHIRATSTNLRRHGIVIVDQTLVVVAKRGVTQSIMHTLVPNNWC